jgi:hypothetical protein
MDRACSTNLEKKSRYRALMGKPEEKRAMGGNYFSESYGNGMG